MKIYLIERTDQAGYDEIESFVCVAESEDDAISAYPSGDFSVFHKTKWSGEWIEKSHLKITDMGIAHDDQKRGVILASYNAG